MLADCDGTVVAAHEVPHRMTVPWPGWAEHDAEAAWWGDFLAVCDVLLADGGGQAVRAVAVSGIGPCFCPAGADGAALRNAILYGVDTRATAEIAELERVLGRDTILRRTGSVLTSQAVGPKLLWYRRNEPELFARTRYILPASSLLIQRLTGEYVVDRHTSSGFNPLYDIEHDEWIEDWCELVLGRDGPPLPRVLWANEVAGEVTAAAAARTGIPRGTPVTAGTVDAAAEALSVAVRRPGDLMLMYGSTMFVILVADPLRPDPRLWGTRYVLPGTSSLAAGTATSGSLTAWFRSILDTGSGAPEFERLAGEAASVAPGSRGLVVLPYFSGERTPIHDPLARGMIAGLTLHHERPHVYRALLEGTAYGVRQILETLIATGSPVKRVVAVGGGVRGDLWPQIVTDVTGVAQEVPAISVGASYGNCLLAAAAGGLTAMDAPGWYRAERTLEPDASNQAVYEELSGVYDELYPATRELTQRLAAVGARTGAASQ
jgi:xylulokinase